MKNRYADPNFDTFKSLFEEEFGSNYFNLREVLTKKAAVFSRFCDELISGKENEIGPLNEMEVKIIRKRLNGFGFEYIAGILNVSKGTVTRANRKGLTKILDNSHKGFIDVVKDYQTGLLSVDDLLEISLDEFVPALLEKRDVTFLNKRFNAYNVKDVVSLDVDSLSNISSDREHNRGQKIINFVHGFGLGFSKESESKHEHILRNVIDIIYSDERFNFWVNSVENIDSLQAKIENQIALIVSELENKSLEKVQCLTNVQTQVLRSYLRIEGNYSSKKEMIKEFGKNEISSNMFNSRLNEAREAIARRAARGCVSLEKAVSNGEITKEELLAMPVRLGSNLEERAYLGLYAAGNLDSGVFNYGDVLSNCSISKVAKYRGVGKSTIGHIINHFNSLGLHFKDESKYASVALESTVVEDKKVATLEKNVSTEPTTSLPEEGNTEENVSKKVDSLGKLRELALELAKCINEIHANEELVKSTTTEIEKLQKTVKSTNIEIEKLQKRKEEIIEIIENSNGEDINRLTLF